MCLSIRLDVVPTTLLPSEVTSLTLLLEIKLEISEYANCLHSKTNLNKSIMQSSVKKHDLIYDFSCSETETLTNPFTQVLKGPQGTEFFLITQSGHTNSQPKMVVLNNRDTSERGLLFYQCFSNFPRQKSDCKHCENQIPRWLGVFFFFFRKERKRLRENK